MFIVSYFTSKGLAFPDHQCFLPYNMSEDRFAIDFLASLQASTEPHNQKVFIRLQDELQLAVITEAQLPIPSGFHKCANLVCDALRWMTAKGQKAHVARINKVLSPYGMLLTTSLIQTHSKKITLDPLLVAKCPALLPRAERGLQQAATAHRRHACKHGHHHLHYNQLHILQRGAQAPVCFTFHCLLSIASPIASFSATEMGQGHPRHHLLTATPP